jgi:hypothetical protein
VRRGVSISVLLVLLSSVIVPLALADFTSTPLCCRVSGQHHCTGMSGGDGFQSLPGKCPYRVAPAVTSGIAALLPVTLVQSSFKSGQRGAELPEPVSLPVAFDNVQKRGPPLS